MGVDAEMFVRVRPPLSDRQIQRLGFEMGGAFSPGKFWVDRKQNRRALYAIDRYEQDGPTLRPKEGEQFVRVQLWDRFYGEGYERGDLPFIIMVAEWLEHRIRAVDGNESAEVWYGGDSSGICATRFDAKRRLELFRYFVEQAHRPYRTGWDLGGAKLSRHCTFCDEPMVQYMWGGADRAGFSCHGCGLQEKTENGGMTWAEAPDEDRGVIAPTDGSTGWVPACLEHADCKTSPKLGAECYRRSPPIGSAQEPFDG